MVAAEVASDAVREPAGQHRYMVVSSDSHVGPSQGGQLRQYCEARYLADFDEDLARSRAFIARAHSLPIQDVDHSGPDFQAGMEIGGVNLRGKSNTAAMAARWEQTYHAAGLKDPFARLRAMDDEGVAADVMFAGGQNDQLLPFSTSGDPALRRVGYDIFNRWMADFMSADPKRLHGVAQIWFGDIDDAVDQIRWAREAGFCSVNFPAPRADIIPYTETRYEPIWEVCAALSMPLNTHGGGGEHAYWTGPGAGMCARAESAFMARRGLWALIYSGAFDRHPNLRLVLTEQTGSWVPDTLRSLDDLTREATRMHGDMARFVPKLPTEYFREHVFIGNSFMSRAEALERDAIGVGNLMYGTDYPHTEGTSPYTTLALRHAFHDVPPSELVAILGENAVTCFTLDLEALRGVADRIGPTVDQLRVPPSAAELEVVPPFCMAFRGG